MRTPTAGAVLLMLTAVPAAIGAPGEGSGAQAIARGDQAWQRRAEGHQGGRAAPGPIGEAVAAYREALESERDNPEARWKLLRALFFEGEYVHDDRDRKLALFAEGRELGDEGRALLARLAGRPDLDELPPEEAAAAVADLPQAASVYFWSAVHWGLWGRHRGKMAAAREGVARKIRDYAEVTRRLDERLENAGGHRILGRLHSEAPKLPFFTGWVDRQTAVRSLERAVELAPQDLLSRLYLAEALLEHVPRRRAEAVGMLERLVEQSPDPAFLVEDSKTLEDARAALARIKG